MGGAKFPAAKPPTVKPAKPAQAESPRTRIATGQGFKTKTGTGDAAPMAVTQPRQNLSVATGDNIVMPTEHPASTTTRTISKGGAL